MINEKKTILFDVKGKKLGRCASEVATMLSGKKHSSYTPNILNQNSHVTVINVSQLDIDTRKQKGKVYNRYSGYFGGRKEERLEEVVKKKGYTEIFRRAVYGMLADNRLRAKKMKQLVIKE